MTNQQSLPDGVLGDDEYRWLTMRAKGGFGLTMTCAAHVQPCGRGFPGQLGIWSDEHLSGLARLAAGINQEGGLSAVQLHHAGVRSPAALIDGSPRAPWPSPDTEVHVLDTREVEQVIEDFISAGLRAELAGFHGVELHGAHGYLLGQFLNAERNQRQDEFGGSAFNRSRIIFRILEGLRERGDPAFQIGVRISPERYGVTLEESTDLAVRLMNCGMVDYVDVSMWDVFKEPDDPAWGGRKLLQIFAELPRGKARLGVAGKIMDGPTVQACLDGGADFVLIGRAAILHADFPSMLAWNPDFAPIPRPVTRDYLSTQGVGSAFAQYLASGWPDLVQAG